MISGLCVRLILIPFPVYDEQLSFTRQLIRAVMYIRLLLEECISMRKLLSAFKYKCICRLLPCGSSGL